MKWLALWIRRVFCYHLIERVSEGRYVGCHTCNRCGGVWWDADGEKPYGSFRSQRNKTEPVVHG